MANIIVELTNHCNFSCKHCFDDRHSANGHLKIEIIEKILQQAIKHGFDHLSFTGGEPTMHPRFTEILTNVCNAGYNFGFVSNGWNFDSIYQTILPYREKLTEITFSLDGARELTHDRLRRRGSYRQLMKAMSICVVKDIPFTMNFVVTSRSRNELREMAELATKLGSQGLRFGHLISTPITLANQLDLSPEERKESESLIWRLQKEYQIPIAMAPGYYTKNLFPCAPLRMQECNIDWRGNVTKCCHLSGHGNGVGEGDVIGNLEEMSFTQAYQQLVEYNRKFHQEKRKHHTMNSFDDSDYFPCWYCLNYFKKVDWLKRVPENSWSDKVWKKG